MHPHPSAANRYSLASLSLGLFFLSPHGGFYRPPPPPGPPIPVYELPPPNTGDSKPKGTPSTPSPGSPSTPGQAGTPSTPRRKQAPKARQGGITIGVDGSSWTYWWEYNKSAFLQPRLLEADLRQEAITQDALLGRGARKEKRSVLVISKEDARRIAIALQSQLRDKDSDQQMIGSCLLSLAKTGHAALPDLAPHLAHAIPMVRESAILAMGISGFGQEELFSILRADPEGTRLCGGRRPGYRERSFATYALGLLAKKKGDPDTSVSVLEAMIDRVKDKRERIDVRVAALQVLRMLDLPKTASKERKEQLATLESLALDGKSSKHVLIQTQAITAMRGPLAIQGLAREKLERRLAITLLSNKSPAPVRQSISQTLGFLSEEEDDDVVQALMQTAIRDKDELTRRFAFMALGRIGGERAQAFLLQGLGKERPRNAEYAWLAIALAMSCHEEQANGTLLLVKARPDIAKAIHHRFRKLNSRMPAAGVAIALGLLEHAEAADAIQKRLQRWKKHDEPAAYLALSLGIMGHRDSKEQITTLMDQSRQREVLVVQSALALSLLGDRRAENKLLTQLEQPQSTPVLSALAMGIGRLGTSASIDSLIQRLDKREGSRSARAFMAVALGELLIQKELRWNAALAWGIHYRYAPASLTGNSGVLDLL